MAFLLMGDLKCLWQARTVFLNIVCTCMFVGLLVIFDLASEVCYIATPVSKYSET